MQLLHEKCPSRAISRSGGQNWPIRSCVLSNPVRLLPVGFSKIFRLCQPTTIPELKEEIRCVSGKIGRHICDKVITRTVTAIYWKFYYTYNLHIKIFAIFRNMCFSEKWNLALILKHLYIECNLVLLELLDSFFKYIQKNCLIWLSETITWVDFKWIRQTLVIIVNFCSETENVKITFLRKTFLCAFYKKNLYLYSLKEWLTRTLPVNLKRLKVSIAAVQINVTR